MLGYSPNWPMIHDVLQSELHLKRGKSWEVPEFIIPGVEGLYSAEKRQKSAARGPAGRMYGCKTSTRAWLNIKVTQVSARGATWPWREGEFSNSQKLRTMTWTATQQKQKCMRKGGEGGIKFLLLLPHCHPSHFVAMPCRRLSLCHDHNNWP